MALEVNPETAVTIRALAAATEAVTANVRKINETMDRILQGKEVVDDLHALIEQHKRIVSQRRAQSITHVEEL
ncbi:uncharacterized protein ACA1_183410 [Acanthamoeba castellanii str. Neff]|uniref:Uncharacterized protein n=1 Tax=Acanthamoeba castellanii (strain ATCC 30010 / Neff) TaxID=1257118 RepID=L8H833_ACACF|nr:uncharacterized protein ACA1_183410 [Acanthamoeba castellanii str. Neff]ELR21407.1 hypothetical protein ACA1_183410 [Acanthamoeba castellanii str. Neff]